MVLTPGDGRAGHSDAARAAASPTVPKLTPSRAHPRPYRLLVARSVGGGNSASTRVRSGVLSNCAASSPRRPQLRTQRVATAITNQWRATRSGSSRRLCCPYHPILFKARNPSSIHLRKPYLLCSTVSGGRGVSKTQRSLCPCPSTTMRVASWRASAPPLAARPTQGPAFGTSIAGGTLRFQMAGRT